MRGRAALRTVDHNAYVRLPRFFCRLAIHRRVGSPKPDSHTVVLSPTRLKLGRFRTNLPRCWHTLRDLVEVGTISAWLRPTLARNRLKQGLGLARNWSDLGQSGPDIGQISASSNDFCQNSVDFGWIWSDVDQHWAHPTIFVRFRLNLACIRPVSGQLSAKFGRLWPKLVQLLAEPGDIRPISTELGVSSAKVGPKSGKCGRLVGRTRPEISVVFWPGSTTRDGPKDLKIFVSAVCVGAVCFLGGRGRGQGRQEVCQLRFRQGCL